MYFDIDQTDSDTSLEKVLGGMLCTPIDEKYMHILLKCFFFYFMHQQIIMAKAAGGPKPKENKDWDED